MYYMSGVTFPDLHRPRRGFTRTDSEPDSEANQPVVNNELSDQAQMRHNAEILAAYISHLRKCYSPRRAVVYIGFLPLSTGCIASTVPCSKLDLCQSLQTLETRHNFSAAGIRQIDLFYEPGQAWTLHLPSDCCLLEKLLTVHPFTRNTSIIEMDHFCDVRQRLNSAACHINHFSSVTILGDAISDNVIVLVHSRSKLRYTSLLVELQDSAEQPCRQSGSRSLRYPEDQSAIVMGPTQDLVLLCCPVWKSSTRIVKEQNCCLFPDTSLQIR
jgi:hypothetical protein